jgi:ABC-type Zn uptake system ZnuABC Zn-binding protein ZnuA
LEVPAGTLTRAEGDVHPFGNPHYLTDPLNGKIVAETVAAALSRARPAHAAYFAQRKQAFAHALDEAIFGSALVDLVGSKKLDRLTRSGELTKFLADQREGGTPLADKLGGWLGRMQPLRGAKLVFYHKSYSYFVERFGLIADAYVEQKPGIQPGPEHLAALVAQMRRDHVPIVATHPFYDSKIAKLVADKGGAKLVVLPLNVGGMPGATDYFKFFDVVIESLTRAQK